MPSFKSLSAAVLLTFAAAAAPAAEAVVVPTYGVFVDPPSGFVFVKLPAGWKFVGKLSEAELKALPPTVVTSLLPAMAERVAER